MLPKQAPRVHFAQVPTSSRAVGALPARLPGAGLSCSDARGTAEQQCADMQREGRVGAAFGTSTTSFPSPLLTSWTIGSSGLERDVRRTDDGWMVCNGIRFGYRGADSLTRWIPEGSSYARAWALADSVRKAQP